MQRNREILKLAYRVFQGCSHDALQAPQLGRHVSTLVGAQQQPLVSLLQQPLKFLSIAAGPSRGATAARLWPARHLATAALGPAQGGVARCSLRQQQQTQWSGFRFRRQYASEAAGLGKASRPAPRSRQLQGKRSLWSGLLLLAPGMLAALLGKWQLDRRNWKLDLLRRRQLMVAAEPVDLFIAEEAPQEYARVRAQGVFDHGKTIYVGPRPRVVMGKAEKGYLAVVPLYNPELHRSVLVNRGWVPACWLQSEEEREKGQPKGQVAVEGVLRLGEQPGEFVPANVPAKAEWYYLNAAEMATACDLPPDTPFVEVISGEVPAYREPTAAELLSGKKPMAPRPADEFPQAKSVEDFMKWSVMPQDHLNYALTWFTLSGFTILMAVKAIRQGLKK